MKKHILMGLFATTILSGCDSVKNTLGMSHHQPDEFSVADNPPLTLPKDYNLRAPVGGIAPVTPNGETHENAADKASVKTLKTKAKKTKKTHADDAVVKKAKKDVVVDENIREKVAAEEVSDNVVDQKLGEIKKNAASLGKTLGKAKAPKKEKISNPKPTDTVEAVDSTEK